MKCRIAIVILNYMNYTDTIACVNCALNQTYTDYEIIIIDNGSSNQSFNILSFIFGGSPKITLLRSRRNLGYVRGNNLGIRYAKSKLKAEYVFVCNSDVLFEKDLFETIVKVDYTGIGAISPTVYNLNGKYQLPIIATDHIYLEVLLTALSMVLSWLYTPLILFLCRLPKKLNRLLQKKAISKVSIRQKYILQGCSYFLTPEFFRYYKQLYPKTFLYGEELNLLVYLKKVKLISLMIKTSPVIHKENGSSRIVFGPQLEQKKLELNTASLMKSLPMYFMKYKEIKKRYH